MSTVADAAYGMPPRGAIPELVRYLLRLGTLDFGGPVALCGLLEKNWYRNQGWLTKREMRYAIAVSQSLPDPLGIQVGTFLSYMRGGFWMPGTAGGPAAQAAGLGVVQ